MIHYFNPGHETAVLNASKYYTPAVNQVKMQEDLSYLPAWYASPEDYVLTENGLTDEFCSFVKSNLPPIAQAITHQDFIQKKEEFLGQSVNLWGISPQGIHVFEQYNHQFGLHFHIPKWKDEYYSLSGRYTAKECLSFLLENLPEIQQDILPCFYSDLSQITNIVLNSKDKLLIKAPYSSSGRGLIWVAPETLDNSSLQILKGMLKKQKSVSIEKALNKQLDFSMHFNLKDSENVEFIGYSVFQTNKKGAYEKSMLASQKYLEQQIMHYINEELLNKVKHCLILFLQQKYAPVYNGCVGVDMLIYKSEEKSHLHPCLEINMRHSMGYLSILLHKNYISEDSTGYFYIDYSKNSDFIYQRHQELQEQYPICFYERRIKSGYFTLCPVKQNNKFHAYLIISK